MELFFILIYNKNIIGKGLFMSDENTIKLLDESPAEELNGSLPHEQTCNSILNIINNNKKLSRKVILLSGVRGAGKTTIIQKLIKKMKKIKYL